MGFRVRESFRSYKSEKKQGSGVPLEPCRRIFAGRVGNVYTAAHDSASTKGLIIWHNVPQIFPALGF